MEFLLFAIIFRSTMLTFFVDDIAAVVYFRSCLQYSSHRVKTRFIIGLYFSRCFLCFWFYNVFN